MKEFINELIQIVSNIKICEKTNNFTNIMAEIEHWQALGNKLESALSDKHDVESWSKKRHDLKAEIKALKKERAELKKEIEKEKPSKKS